MCGIIFCGPKRLFSKNTIESCLNDLKIRGPDSYAIFDGNNDDYWLVYSQLKIVGNDSFPIIEGKFTLVGNLEIYTYKEIFTEFMGSELEWRKEYSDARVILILFCRLIKSSQDKELAFKKLLEIIKEDYAFVISDNEGNLFIARDPVGIRPLYYSVSNGSKWGVSSTVDSLISLGFKQEEITTVPPGTYSISNCQNMSESIQWKKNSLCLSSFVHNRSLDGINYTITWYNNKLNELHDLLLNSVKKRVPDNEFSFFLSGGIDSSLLLALLLKIVSDREINVISVGFPNSSDIEYSTRLCKDLNIKLNTVFLTRELVMESTPKVLSILKNRSKIILDDNLVSPVDLSISLPLYMASKCARSFGSKVAFSGQGADELFIGYKKYFVPPHDSDKEILSSFLEKEILNIAHQNLERDDIVSMASSIEIRFPYLDLDVISWVMKQELSLFLSDNGLRKQILRDIAANLGLPPYIVYRKKKAAQYGTKLMKMLKKEAKFHKTLSDFINSL